MAVLAKSALREAFALGDIKFMAEDGSVLREWSIQPTFVMPSDPQPTLAGLISDSVLDGFAFEQGDPEGLQCMSLDMHLGDEWLIPQANLYFEGGEAIDTARKIHYTERKCPSITIPAHGFILGRTLEVIQLSPELSAHVDGRSSFGRAGVFVQNAGYVDGGFAGSITLELYNANSCPIIIYAGTKACQLVVTDTVGDSEGGYKGQYQGQIHPKGSGIWKHVPKSWEGRPNV